jgi:hypothetical protein
LSNGERPPAVLRTGTVEGTKKDAALAGFWMIAFLPDASMYGNVTAWWLAEEGESARKGRV